MILSPLNFSLSSHVFPCVLPHEVASSALFHFKAPTPILQGDDNPIDAAHETECTFLELTRGLRGLPCPEVYAVERPGKGRPGCLLMQDMRHARSADSHFECASEALCLSMAEATARLQVLTAAMPGQPWRGRFRDVIKEISFRINEQHTDDSVLWPYDPGGFWRFCMICTMCEARNANKTLQ